MDWKQVLKCYQKNLVTQIHIVDAGVILVVQLNAIFVALKFKTAQVNQLQFQCNSNAIHTHDIKVWYDMILYLPSDFRVALS